MKKFSEKELEEAYKNIRMMEAPDMWEKIERNLAPKQTETPKEEHMVPFEKKKTKVRIYISAAAVVLLLLIPVSYTMNMGYQGIKSKGKSDLSQQESADMAVSEESSRDIADASGAEDGIASEGGMNETEAEYNSGAEDTAGGGTGKENDTAAAPESAEQGSAGGSQQSSGKAKEIQLEVQVIRVRNTGEGLQITAEVAKESGSGYGAGEEVEILYEGTAYQEGMFQGNMKVRLQKEENILKLLEILP